MKKLLAFIVLSLLLTGCSAKSTNIEMNSNSGVTTSTTIEKQVPSSSTQESQTNTNETQISEEEKGWFTGVIGSSKIHAKLDFSDKSISGVYYYDKYKTNIKIEGDIGNELKDIQTICLTEDTVKAGEFYGILKTPDYIEGYWREGEDIHPMYLIKSGSGINPPEQPDTEAKKFDGKWMGEESSYYCTSYTDIKILFKDLLYYDIESNNGANIGSLTGLAVIDQGKAVTRYSNEYGEEAFFNFSINNGKLKLDSDNYSFMCGAGVSHMSDYVKGKFVIPLPRPEEIGIVDTKEQADKFKALVGDMYEDFISLTSAASKEEYTMDGKKVSVRNSYLRGLANECIYIVSSEHLYAAIVSEAGIEYYTDDKNYSDKLPGPIKEWTKDKSDLEVIYHFKQ